MIQEEYVTFEQAKALKELGFPQNEPYIYLDSGEFDIKALNKKVWLEHQPYYACPTLSLVQKWLREENEYEISIEAFPHKYEKKYNITIVDANHYSNYHSYECVFYETKDTYEQALSARIDKCIELLKKI